MNARVFCPKIRMPAAVWERLMAYIQACPQEVGGLGTVENAGNELVVSDVILLKQKVSSATTALDREAVARFVADWVRTGQDVGKLRLWWHSHATMNVFWSSTDCDTMKELADGGWLLSIVGNHNGETMARLTLGGEVSVAVDGLAIDVFTAVSDQVKRAAEAEVKAKVRTAIWHRGFPMASEERGVLSAETDPESVWGLGSKP